MMQTRQNINIYINFVLYAVLGDLARADDLLERHGAQVRSVAGFMAFRRPVQHAPVFRGMLVEPEQPVRPDSRYGFLSWSEDRDVACWFAERDSVISGHVLEHRPQVRGVVLSLPTARNVLFHHSWASEDWAEMAALHPHMGIEGARQFAWSLRTQREVITDQLVELPHAVPVEDVPHAPLHELDARLAPPWLIGAFS